MTLSPDIAAVAGKLTVHFIASMNDNGEKSACSVFEPTYMSGHWEEVTCGRCRRSRRYRAAQIGETLFFSTYRSAKLAHLLGERKDG